MIEPMNPFIKIFFILFAVSIPILLVYFKRYNDGYREGQIDALSGNKKYEKKDNKRGETIWAEIENHKP